MIPLLASFLGALMVVRALKLGASRKISSLEFWMLFAAGLGGLVVAFVFAWASIPAPLQIPIWVKWGVVGSAVVGILAGLALGQFRFEAPLVIRLTILFLTFAGLLVLLRSFR